MSSSRTAGFPVTVLFAFCAGIALGISITSHVATPELVPANIAVVMLYLTSLALFWNGLPQCIFVGYVLGLIAEIALLSPWQAWIAVRFVLCAGSAILTLIGIIYGGSSAALKWDARRQKRQERSAAPFVPAL